MGPLIQFLTLSRIEVLKGPQGTLYGADSLGGLIKVVTKDPSMAGITGSVQMLGDGVIEGGLGYGVRGAINIPLSNTLAIRASGFSRRDPGYIDNITTGQNNVDSVDVFGGRIAGCGVPTTLYRSRSPHCFRIRALRTWQYSFPPRPDRLFVSAMKQRNLLRSYVSRRW